MGYRQRFHPFYNDASQYMTQHAFGCSEVYMKYVEEHNDSEEIKAHTFHVGRRVHDTPLFGDILSVMRRFPTAYYFLFSCECEALDQQADIHDLEEIV